ncbi:hypothetical protein K1719_025968 [Acacia pycnantha]|nr:hypothetical protein K1719_025968 [Acacia pycnantha]
MVKLASARDFRTYGTGMARNRYEYINAGLYLFAAVVLTCGFAAQLSSEPKSGLVLLLIAFGLIFIVNLHDLISHLAGIDFLLSLMEFDLQLALVEFGVPITQAVGSLLSFLGIFFIFIQEEKRFGYFKLERHALNLLLAGPLLWVIGSIHNSCQIYERADGHVQILLNSVLIPFLMGSLLFLLAAILNHYEQSSVIHHGLHLLGGTWVWLGIFGSMLLFIGGLTNVVKVFKMQQIDGLRLEALRGGAQERLMSEREGRVPLILEDQRRRTCHVGEDAKIVEPAPTPYKDVLIGHTCTP